MIIAVDFDGTIVEDRYPEIGNEIPFATEVLRKLIEQRHHIILWTMRNGKELDEAINWCRKRGVEFYAINTDSSDLVGDGHDPDLSYKVHADIFIDDRNIGGLPSWTDIYHIIQDGTTYEQVIRRRVRKEAEAFEQPTPPYPKWMFWKNKQK